MSDTARQLHRMSQRIGLGEVIERPLSGIGTWTPAFVGTTIAGTFTYSFQVGHWTRLSNIVYIIARVGISAITVNPTGNMTVTGLPFTSNNVTGLQPVIPILASNFNHAAGAIDMLGLIQPSTTVIELYEGFANAGIVQTPAANFNNANCNLFMTGFYEIA